MTALMTAYLAALALASPAKLQSSTPPSPPYAVILNTGDAIYDASSITPIYVATKNFDNQYVLATQFVKTAPPSSSSTVPAADPTSVIFGDGHALFLGPDTKIQILSPVVTAPSLNGAAVYLSYGQATITNVSTLVAAPLQASIHPVGLPPAPSQIIVKTKATSTGAKGTTVSISATVLGSYVSATVTNYQSTECLLWQGDSSTPASFTTLPVGSRVSVDYPGPVPTPIPIPGPSLSTRGAGTRKP